MVEQQHGHDLACHIGNRDACGEVALSRDALSHMHLNFADGEPLLAHQVGHRVGLGSQIGPGRQKMDGLAIVGAHAGRGVVDLRMRAQAEERGEQVASQHAHAVGLRFRDEARADHDVVVLRCRHDLIEVFGAVLPVGVELHGAVVMLAQRIFDARLESARQTEVHGQVQKTEAVLTAYIGRSVLRAIVDHDVIVLGIGVADLADHTRNVCLFVIGWYDQKRPHGSPRNTRIMAIGPSAKWTRLLYLSPAICAIDLHGGTIATFPMDKGQAQGRVNRGGML